MSQIGSSSPYRGETRKYLKPPSRFWHFVNRCVFNVAPKKSWKDLKDVKPWNRWFGQRKLPLLGPQRIGSIVRVNLNVNHIIHHAKFKQLMRPYTLLDFCFSALASLLVRHYGQLFAAAAIAKGHKLHPVCIYFSQKWKFLEAVIRNAHLYLMVRLMEAILLTSWQGKDMVNIWQICYHWKCFIPCLVFFFSDIWTINNKIIRLSRCLKIHPVGLSIPPAPPGLH